MTAGLELQPAPTRPAPDKPVTERPMTDKPLTDKPGRTFTRRRGRWATPVVIVVMVGLTGLGAVTPLATVTVKTQINGQL